jgi:hypothetical protein
MKLIILFVTLVSQAFITFAVANVEVFTSRTEWDTRVASCSSRSRSTADFTLSDGGNSTSRPPLVGGTSTDLGWYYSEGFLSNIGGPTLIRFENFDIGSIIAFAGDWRHTTRFDNGLQVSINGDTIKFSDYLETGDGSGFLGYVVDEASAFSFIDLTLAGSGDGESFTLDNAMTAGQCVPTTLAQAS